MIFKQINRLQQLDQLIRQKRTGSADDLAQRLNLSRRQVYNWIDQLRDLGLEIEYNRGIQSFYYVKSYKVSIVIGIENLTDSEFGSIEAGINFKKNNYLCYEIAQTPYTFGVANINNSSGLLV